MRERPDMIEVEALRERVRQLERMNEAMMDRIERTADSVGSAYAMFEANILMQKAVHERTRDAERAAERLEIATSAARIGVWEWDVATGVLRWDATMKELYSLPRDVTVPYYGHWRDAVLPEDLEGAESLLHRAVLGKGQFNARFRIRDPEGRIRHIRAFASGTDVVDGRATRLIGVNYDITEQVERQIELRRWNETLLHTGRIARTGGWILERDGDAWNLHWTEVVRQIHEVDDDFEPTLETAIAFYAPEASDEIAAAVADAIESGTPFDLVLPFVTARGRDRWVRAMGEAVFDDERCIRVAGAFQDVTEQHLTRMQLEDAMRRAEAASAAKSEFLANMSHEIRTPMTAIVGYADLLDGDPEIRNDESKLQDAVRTIRTNASHLLRVVNDILDVSKIEAGRLQIERLTVNVAHLVHQVVKGLAPLAEGKGISLDLELESPIPASVTTDPTRLKQIVTNLLGNAIKFTEVGHVRVRLAMDDDSDRFRVSIEDSGIGMNEAQLESIRSFQAFTQVDGSMTRRFGGTGLGLRISSSLAQMLGGRLHIHSTFGEGSTFSFTIDPGELDGVEWLEPEALADRLESWSGGPAQGPDLTDAPSLEDMRILLAEDGPDNQRLISFLLQKAGATVTIVNNGMEALQTMDARRATTDEQPFDIILMDMQMPRLDGYSSTKRLKERGCTIPIIALTAHAMEGDRERCLDAGCDDYMTKPVQRSKLIDACRTWAAIRGRRAA